MTLDDVKKDFSGKVITPKDAGYEAASTTLVREGSPAVIFACANAKDVVLALTYARRAGLLVSVRSGGHSNAGLSTNDGGAVIDVSPINSVTMLDEAAGRVRIGAGAIWVDAARALDKYGLAISSGDTRTVGVGGLTLGGGIGWMVRKYGLTIDSLQSAEIVMASGDILSISAESHPDLFWAIRGGGGNFGVVTSFEFIAQPVSGIFFGSVTYPITDAAIQLRAWRDCVRAASEDLTSTALLMPAMGPEMPARFIVTTCWAGDDAGASEALAPLRKLPGTVIEDTIVRKHYYEVLEDIHMPPNIHVEVNNAFFRSLTDALVDKLAAAQRDHNTMLQIRHLGGAVNRIAVDATAFGHRDNEIMILSPLMLPAGSDENTIQAALAPWYEIAKDSTGAYVNFLSRNEDRTVRAAYPPETLERLKQIKMQYDPENIFNQNLNIKPVKE